MPTNLRGEFLGPGSWTGPRRIGLMDRRGRRGRWLQKFFLEIPSDARLWLLPGGRFAVPERLSLELHQPFYPAVVLDYELERGKYVCAGVRRQTGSPEITGRLLRDIPFERPIQEALHMAAVQVTQRRDGSFLSRLVLETMPSIEAFLDEADRTELRPKRGRKLNQKHYEAVAQTVITARATGRPVLTAIREEFDASLTTAKRWKREVEALRLIPEPGARSRGRKEKTK